MLEIVLDLSRLISRVRHTTPTGIDRVELAYAEGLLGLYGDQLSFAVVHRGRFYGRVSRPAALAFLAFTARRWSTGAREGWWRRWRTTIYWMARLRPRRIPPAAGSRVLVQASPHHLHKSALVQRILKRESAPWVVLVHDLIPITHPEFARPGGSALHRRRVETIARYATAIVTNSDDTALRLQPYLPSPPPLVRRAHLGTLQVISPAEPIAVPFADAPPYFVALGTIEPRKNHLLLLNIWRRMVAEMDATKVPRLVIIGRRGWENENVVDMLDRCDLLHGHVSERGHVTDEVLGSLLLQSRALLMPSFAEGFGMPLAEALGGGIPAIASDLPVLREIGGDVPDYLDPLDGPGWMRTILDYSRSRSKAREAQLHRLKTWQRPDWASHFSVVSGLVNQVRA